MQAVDFALDDKRQQRSYHICTGSRLRFLFGNQPISMQVLGVVLLRIRGFYHIINSEVQTLSLYSTLNWGSHASHPPDHGSPSWLSRTHP